MSCRTSIAGGVGLVGLVEQILGGTLGDDDDGVLARVQPAVEVREEAVGTDHVELDLGHEDEIRVAIGEDGMGGDKAGVATHELDQADAVGRAERFDVGAADSVGGDRTRPFRSRRCAT